ncbi:MAG: DegT/DnrJ/EryC1/StrS family aminotransferase [Bacteroidota bacterium]
MPAEVSAPGALRRNVLYRNVPITKVWYDAAEAEAVSKPIESGWVVQGPYTREFEARFAEFTDVLHAVACTSCTTALHLALEACGIGPGDEVIVPAFTWVSTANAVLYAGATPVFCDIRLDTFNIDPDLVEALITPRTKAILPVHLFGYPADMPRLLGIAQKHNLVVIEDAACGFGSAIYGQHVGTFGEAGCFSFHPRKAISTGEGGMVITSDAAIDERCRILRNHGGSPASGPPGPHVMGRYAHLGYNYRLTDIQSALGVAQMGKADAVLAGRRQWAKAYDDALADNPMLRIPRVPDGWTHSYQSYVLLYAPEAPTWHNLPRLHAERNALMARLAEAGIGTRPGTHAVHTLDYYRKTFGLRPEDAPNAFIADQCSFAIPLFPQMTDADHAHVAQHLLALTASVPVV